MLVAQAMIVKAIIAPAAMRALLPYTRPVPDARTPAAATPTRNVRALSGLLPFLRPYRGRIALADVQNAYLAGFTKAEWLSLKSLLERMLDNACACRESRESSGRPEAAESAAE